MLLRPNRILITVRLCSCNNYYTCYWYLILHYTMYLFHFLWCKIFFPDLLHSWRLTTVGLWILSLLRYAKKLADLNSAWQASSPQSTWPEFQTIPMATILKTSIYQLFQFNSTYLPVFIIHYSYMNYRLTFLLCNWKIIKAYKSWIFDDMSFRNGL